MVLTWSEVEYYWIAEASDLPGASADGSTPNAAIAHLPEALRVSLLVASDQGIVVPPPRSYEQYAAEEDAASLSIAAN
ncbi:MAG: hypothetical protein ABI068_00275 [Ktedonobacterales bacterium]